MPSRNSKDASKFVIRLRYKEQHDELVTASYRRMISTNAFINQAILEKLTNGPTLDRLIDAASRLLKGNPSPRAFENAARTSEVRDDVFSLRKKFVVRFLEPELHQQLVKTAQRHSISMNDWINRAIDEKLKRCSALEWLIESAAAELADLPVLEAHAKP